MRKTIFIAAALVAMTGCNKELIETPIAGSDFGYINLGVTTDTEMVVTKADNHGITSEASLTGYTISLTKNTEGSSTEVWSKSYENIAVNDWKVPAGNYTIKVYNKTITDTYAADSGKGMVRVEGTGTAAVSSGAKTSCTVNCAPVNSKVSFIYTDSFKNLFTFSGNYLTVTNTATVAGYPSRTVNMTMGATHTDANAAFFESSEHTWSLTVTNAVYGEKTFTGNFTPGAGKWAQIKFDAGATNGQIDVTITVDNSIDDEDKVETVITINEQGGNLVVGA